MGFGITRIDLGALAGALHLPKECKIISVQQEPGYGDGLSLLLESPDLPNAEEYGCTPDVSVVHTLECHPEDPAFRKISGQVEVNSFQPRSSAYVAERLR